MFTCLVNGQRVYAWDIHPNDARQADLRCPECNGVVIFKKCSVCRDHFAHTRESNCNYGSGESSEHIECKIAIYNDLKLFFQEEYDTPGAVVELEYKHPNSGPKGKRADVFLRLPNKQGSMAVEVQKSDITVDTINERTQYWNSLGISVWWIIPVNKLPYQMYDITINAWKKHLSIMQRTKNNGLWFYEYGIRENDKYVFLELQKLSRSKYKIVESHHFYPDVLFQNRYLGYKSTNQFVYGRHNENCIPSNLKVIVPKGEYA